MLVLAVGRLFIGPVHGSSRLVEKPSEAGIRRMRECRLGFSQRHGNPIAPWL